MTTSEQYWFKRGYNNALAAMSERVEEAFDALGKENRRGRASFFTQGNPGFPRLWKKGRRKGCETLARRFWNFGNGE